MKIRLTAGRNVANVLTDQEQRQATSLQEAYYIAFACSPDFSQAHWHTDSLAVHVEILVHTKVLKHNRRGTLIGRLADSVKVEHAEPICLSCNKTVHLTRNRRAVILLLRRAGVCQWRARAPASARKERELLLLLLRRRGGGGDGGDGGAAAAGQGLDDGAGWDRGTCHLTWSAGRLLRWWQCSPAPGLVLVLANFSASLGVDGAAAPPDLAQH